MINSFFYQYTLFLPPENIYRFLCFQGVVKEFVGNKEVKIVEISKGLNEVKSLENISKNPQRFL